jgi:hypothetical protein
MFAPGSVSSGAAGAANQSAWCAAKANIARDRCETDSSRASNNLEIEGQLTTARTERSVVTTVKIVLAIWRDNQRGHLSKLSDKFSMIP